MSNPGGAAGAHAAAHRRRITNAIKAFGVIVQVAPQSFLEIIEKQEKLLILEALGGIWFRAHYRYLTSYKGLTFFTKCYNSLDLPEDSEIMKVKYIEIPNEQFKIY